MCPVSLGFKTPLDPTIIWRYMPLSKFKTSVQSSALWFAAASSFPDRTKAAAEASARDRLWDRLGVSEEQRETIRGLTDWNRQFSFVNCWMMNTKESDLMWRAYAGANGVAIESTYGRLRSVLLDLHPRSGIHRLRERSHDQRALSCTDLLQAKRICR